MSPNPIEMGKYVGENPMLLVVVLCVAIAVIVVSILIEMFKD